MPKLSSPIKLTNRQKQAKSKSKSHSLVSVTFGKKKGTETKGKNVFVPTFRRKAFMTIEREMEYVLVGQKAVLTEIIISVLSGGHVLLNGVPGLAKTLIVKSLARIFDLKYSRIQFTPDLMPADLIGYEIIEEKKKGKELKFVRGPIFAQIILADEINRSPAKTQAALLEAMEEKSITVMGKTHILSPPFLVLATQNPLEQKGTYELPEAELDRFMSMINITYPHYEEELSIADRLFHNNMPSVACVFKKKDYIEAQQMIAKVKVSPEVLAWIVRLVRSTRPHDKDAPEITKQYIEVGASVRATQNLSRAAQTAAYLNEREYIEKSDILLVMKMILRHRIRLTYEADTDKLSADTIIEKIATEL